MPKYDLKNIYAWPSSLQFLIIGIACAIILYMAYMFDFTSLSSDINKNKLAEKDLKQQLEILFDQQATIENDISNLIYYQKILDQWQNKLITTAKLSELLNELVKIGTTNGLKFSLFTPGEEIKEDIYLKTPLKIIASGNYHQIANFISQAVNSQWMIVIRNLNITKQKVPVAANKSIEEQVSLKNILSAEMTLEIYNRGDK